ncbi:DNA-binding response regulator [Corallincola holothuriorum]|uniref:DNA-binding response regulator n=1 Tax=Corallincola holothuriorum TaxID=2282215 RepID=A0A368NPE7_9GAMM|nr:response regulator transcription factor [Corallincola holothuriorum]RCU51773.1 DNA-binding response regulator [Corallincola holothuriorum]
MTPKYAVLVVEDNQDIAIQLVDYLADKGLVVDYAADGKTALQLLAAQRYDIVVLDLMLPDMDGLSICNHIKQNLSTNIPVLMLTARDSLDEKVQGFGVGADDYLTKPFALQEMYVRCLALGKRHQLHQQNTLTIGELEVNFHKHSATRAGQPLSLSSTDFTILKLLADAYPNAVSKRQLTEQIWGDEAPQTDVLRSHIYTLRNALDKPFSYPMLKTLHGIGFRLALPSE